jgi:hypothetical protein
MKKYEVEVEVIYLYGIEAEDENAATRAAHAKYTGRAPYLDCTIASIHAEAVDHEPGHYHHEPPGMCSGINLTPP